MTNWITNGKLAPGMGVITTSEICKSCIVEVYGKKLEADLFVLDTGGYNVILGMSWLSKHHAVIDCRDKSITFRIPHQPEFKFTAETKTSRQRN